MKNVMTKTAAIALLVTALFACSCSSTGTTAETPGLTQQAKKDALPGMPPVVNAANIYSETTSDKLSPLVKDLPERIYVPNAGSNSVTVIDAKTYKVINEFPVGRQPQHVTPSYDIKTLWVLNDLGDSLTKIDPKTSQKGETVKVMDPYNMYYTPDGKYAIVVAERLRQLDFREPNTMKLVQTLKVPCRGIDHMDFSADGRYLLASCEFSSEMVKVDVAERKVLGTLKLKDGGMPQDVKLSPDGKIFYVADMMSDGVYLIDGDNMKILGHIPTGKGTHGLYPSRDGKVLYISNRGEGSVSLLDFATRKLVAKWKIPGGGSPDMGNVSADGKTLWLSGRYNNEVYAFDTGDGHLLARIKVGKNPHGLCVYPQPGRYSMGHTGVFR